MNPRCLPLRALAGALLLLLAVGCDRAPSSATHGATQVHATTGEVREIAVDRTKAVIRHEEIPGYMPAMTMELNVRDPRELAGVAAGDRVAFRLLADNDTHWIDSVRKIGTVTNAPAPVAVSSIKPLKPGDPLPPVTVQTEHGTALSLADLRGQAFAFTFIFTRCPLPDFCPRMNKRFTEARDLLNANASAPTNWMLLSLSFDPEFDTPAVLRSHAKGYRGEDTRRWTFAVADQATLRDLAPRVDLRLMREPGTISHNLRTVVVDPAGRVFRQLDGNFWSAADLTNALWQATAAVNPDERAQP